MSYVVWDGGGRKKGGEGAISGDGRAALRPLAPVATGAPRRATVDLLAKGGARAKASRERCDPPSRARTERPLSSD